MTINGMKTLDARQRHDRKGTGSTFRPVNDVFPCVGLIISGGHTSLYRCQDGRYFARRLTWQQTKNFCRLAGIRAYQ